MNSVPRVTPQLFSWMRDIRETIHRHPELSFEELTTAAYIQRKLDEIGVSSVQHLAGTGLLAEIASSSDSQVVVGLRADMDALPITEGTDLEFSSVIPGVMHACGHDGHVAMLLGAAVLLLEMDIPGRVRLIFQPAEEKGNGAVRMMEEGALQDLSAIFSGHIDTHYETGIITVDEGIICAYADPFVIRLSGSSGHAARPHECRDVIVAAASFITSLQSLVSREVNPNQAAVLTIGKISAGETHNVIAEKAVIEGTIRSTHPQVREQMIDGLKRMAKGCSLQYQVGVDLAFTDFLPAVKNECEAASIAGSAARAVVSVENVISQGPSSLGGEDFAFYLEKIPGCMVRFGAKPTAAAGPAHSPSFNFDDAVLPVGASWYAEVARIFHQNYST